MTLEEALFKWFEEVLDEQIVTVPGSSKIALDLDDYTQMNKWQGESIFVFDTQFKSKRQSSDISRQISEAAKLLPLKPGINTCYVESIRSIRKDNPSQWNYIVVLRIRHREWFEWKLTN